jgi:hypothetical protein
LCTQGEPVGVSFPTVAQAAILRKFGRELLESRCGHLLQLLAPSHFEDPGPPTKALSAGWSRLPEPYRTLVPFLLFGEPARVSDLERLLGYEGLEVLAELGLVKREGGEARLDRCRLVGAAGLLVFVPLMSGDAGAVTRKAGAHRRSLLLARWTRVPRGAITLGLGAGSGLQAMAAGRTASRAVAVEVDQTAYALARINAALNALDHKVEAFCGNLYGPVGEQMFDVVTAASPFLTSPEDKASPSTGAGGEDGLNAVREIVEGFIPHARGGARCYLALEAVGQSHEPESLCCVLRSWVGKRKDALLWILGREAADDPSPKARDGYTHVFDCLVMLCRTAAEGDLVVEDLSGATQELLRLPRP